MSNKLMPATKLPPIELSLISGESYTIGQQEDSWELVLIYRGKHCPRCKTYLNKLQGLTGDLEKLNVKLIVATADPLEKVQADVAEFGWTFPIGYNLTPENMKDLGLWVSSHADGSLFAEPGLFVLNPENTIQMMGIGNAASCRPDLDVLLDGINGIQTRGLPIFGTTVV